MRGDKVKTVDDRTRQTTIDELFLRVDPSPRRRFAHSGQMRERHPA